MVNKCRKNVRCKVRGGWNPKEPNWMTVQGILSPGKQAMKWACQGEKKTAQRRKGLPVRVLRIERQKKSTTNQERKVLCLWQRRFLCEWTKWQRNWASPFLTPTSSSKKWMRNWSKLAASPSPAGLTVNFSMKNSTVREARQKGKVIDYGSIQKQG